MKFFLLVLIFVSFFTNAQQFCHTDEVHNSLFVDYPQYNNQITRAKNKLENETQQFNQSNRANATYVIPVVFHVIHQNGIENISDEQIKDQIHILNRDYNAQNDTSVIINAFKPLVANCDIEFRLATKDSNGNCTNGITRHVSSLTTSGDHAVKSIVHWPPNMYLNIYVVSNAAGLAGHALLPYAADSLPQWDGIVMSHSYVGSIGTSSVATSVVGSHEVGHYLNLQHVWGGNNVPNFPYLPVSDAGNCSYDDGVGDTPNTIGNQSCNLSANSCSSLDNVQNFMDYSYCGAMFTEGQKTRMHACLNSTVANRNNLWSPANLIATGVDSTSQDLCKAEFSIDKSVVCVGDTLTFIDKSYHKTDNRMWDFYGGNAISLTDSIVKVTYSNLGHYNVKLVVYNGANSDSIVKNKLITVNSSTPSINFLTDDFESLPTFPNNKWSTAQGDSNWASTNIAGYNSNNSLLFSNFYNTTKVDLISTTMNLSNYSNVELTFNYAYAQKEANSSDKLNIYFSNDCGENWAFIRTYSMFTLLSKYSVDTNYFIPQNNSEWKTANVPISSMFRVNNFQLKLEFLGTAKGNNIYVDNINVIDPATASVNENWKDNIKVYPNPAQDILFIDNLKEGTKVSLLDVSGKTLEANFLKNRLSVNGLKQGIYFLKIDFKGKVVVKKFVKD